MLALSLPALCLAALLSVGGPASAQPAIIEGRVLLRDDFSRFGKATSALGKVPGSQLPWVARVPVQAGKPMEGIVVGQQGQVVVAYSSGSAPYDTGMTLERFSLADGIFSLTVGPSLLADRAHTAFLSYRARSAQAAAGGLEPGAYHLQLVGDWTGSHDVVLSYGREPLACADLAPERRRDAPHRVKVAFAGNRHLVWVDGKPAIDVWEIAPGRAGAGLVGFGGFYSAGGFDDFEVRAARPGSRGPQPVRGRINPLVFQGRPFFVLGNWDYPGDDDAGEWLAAGGNTFIQTVAPPVAGDPPALPGEAKWAARHGVAVIYQPLVDWFSREGQLVTVTRAEERAAKGKQLEAILGITARDPQRLGYYTFDEPENNVYAAYKEWEAKKDRGLAGWMAEGLRWTSDTIHQKDPHAYVMPTIAWWTTYEGLAPLYDVNLANEYPTHAKDEPLTGALYNVVYDAAKAADAVRAAGRTSFVYTPGAWDVSDPGDTTWRPATLRELRYCAFAPLTQGAMGVFTWRLNRCSPTYRQAVVYPVMREVKRLVPWLLGEWCEGKVTSDHDTATAPYLKEFPARVRTVEGEEQAPKVEVPGVPDCAYVLRRRPTNSYLLLAVSNRKEPMGVTFALRNLQGLPGSALEALEHRRVPIAAGRIYDTLEPFAVRAYVIEPR